MALLAVEMPALEMLAVEVPPRVVIFSGLVNGLVFAMLAMGIILIYRNTRVINFAVGNMGLPGATLFALLIINWGWPFWLALVTVLVVGALIGTVIELTIVRRLFDKPRVILLVATVGIAQTMQAVNLALPEVDGEQTQYPVAIGAVWENVLGLRQLKGPQLQILIVVPLVALALGWWLTRTTFGKSITASADNPSLSRLSGINPKIVSTIVWTVGGLLATLSIILFSGGSAAAGISGIGILTLTNGLVAAVLAGMRSIPRAILGGLVVGLTIDLFTFYDLGAGNRGLDKLILFVAVVAAIYRQSRSGDEGVMSFVPKITPLSERVRRVFWVRHLGRIVVGVLTVAVVLVVWNHESIAFIELKPSRLLLYSIIVIFMVLTASLIVITGWSGQLSLAQMAYAGIGALSAAAFHNGLSADIGWGERSLFVLELPAMPQLWAILLAAVTTAGVAAVTGLGALRVRGLMLAVSTFVFGIAAQSYLYQRPILSGGSRSVIFDRGYFWDWHLLDNRNFFVFVVACAVLVISMLGRIRRSGVGRSIVAVRDNPEAAAAYAISPARTKLLAFAIAGGVAGFGGGLLGNALRQIRYEEAWFGVHDSLSVVGMSVIGGLGSVMGAVIGALWIQGLPSFWPDNDVVPLFTSGVGLILILMYFPGGFSQVGYAIGAAVARKVESRLPPEDPTESATVPPAAIRSSHREIALPQVPLRTVDVSVRFGGNRAVTGVSLEVRRDEIVGLIGTNGAGKSTLMNAVGGFVGSDGTIELMGMDVAGRSPAERAGLGLGRTFQAATLFPELTVRQTVQVALEARGRTSLLRTALFLDGRRERRQRATADEILDFLGLGRYADHYVSDLSTGTRRIVELAGLLAVDARVLCLDEPTAGLAQREAEAFEPLITEIRRELGASMLVIEHDMPLIMSISDRVYCLESGSIIAEGDPATVRNDPAVIAGYLGTDSRAIDRSEH